MSRNGKPAARAHAPATVTKIERATMIDEADAAWWRQWQRDKDAIEQAAADDPKVRAAQEALDAAMRPHNEAGKAHLEKRSRKTLEMQNKYDLVNGQQFDPVTRAINRQPRQQGQGAVTVPPPGAQPS